jgi:hypothetical protein
MKVAMDKIIIPESFKKTNPRREKLNMIKEYLSEHGEFDKPVVLDGCLLKDGYARYVAAKELGIKEIECENIGSYDRICTGKFKEKGKEYTWKIPKGINVKVDDTILVENRNKTYIVKVSSVSKLTNSEMLKHKSVIKRIRNKK